MEMSENFTTRPNNLSGANPASAKAADMAAQAAEALGVKGEQLKNLQELWNNGWRRPAFTSAIIR